MIHLPAEKQSIQKVGFCTGGAQDFIAKAALKIAMLIFQAKSVNELL